MTSSTILVHFPFPLAQISSATIVVCYETKIFEIIKSCLILQSRPDLNPCDYCIVIRPTDEILLPYVSVNDYRKSFLKNNQVSFYLIPKMYFTVRLNVISVQITTICDGNQTIWNLLTQIKNASPAEKTSPLLSFDSNLSRVNLSYISDQSGLISFIKNQPIKINTRMNDILRNNHYKTPVITIKRQNANPILSDKTICPVFKNSLEAALARDHNNDKVPFFLTKIFQLVENFRDTVGIYRKSGDFNTIDTISKKIDATTDQSQLSAYLEQQTAHELACTVKLYLRQLSEAVIPSYLAKDFYSVLTLGEASPRRESVGPAFDGENNDDEEMIKIIREKINTLPPPSKPTTVTENTESSEDKMTKKLSVLKSLLRALPKPNYDLFESLCQHLEKIVENSSVNQMNYKNLAICIGTNIVRVTQGLDAVRVAQETSDAQSVCQLVFENWKKLFTGPSPQTVAALEAEEKDEGDMNTFKVIKQAIAFMHIPNLSIAASGSNPSNSSTDLSASNNSMSQSSNLSGSNPNLNMNLANPNLNMGSNPNLSMGSNPNLSMGSNPNLNMGSNPNFGMGSNPNLSMGSNPNLSMGSNPNLSMGSNPNLSMGSNPNFGMGSNPNLSMGYSHHQGMGSNPSLCAPSNPNPVPLPLPRVMPVTKCNIFVQGGDVLRAGAVPINKSTATGDGGFVLKPANASGFNAATVSCNRANSTKMGPFNISSSELAEANDPPSETNPTDLLNPSIQRRINVSSSFNIKTRASSKFTTVESQMAQQQQQPFMQQQQLFMLQQQQPFTQQQQLFMQQQRPVSIMNDPQYQPQINLSDTYSSNSSTGTVNQAGRIGSSSSFNMRTRTNQRKSSNLNDAPQTAAVRLGSKVKLIEKCDETLDGMKGPAWIVEYNNTLIKIDSAALEPLVKEKPDISLIVPEPTSIVPLNPFGSISLKTLSQRKFLQPDDLASQVALNGPDAHHVAERLRAIESQLNSITDEYNNGGRNPETCAKLRKLLRQLSSF